MDPEDDGNVFARTGKEYTIEVYGYSSAEFDFTVEQDNWVYAKDGGIWRLLNIQTVQPLRAHFVMKEYICHRIG